MKNKSIAKGMTIALTLALAGSLAGCKKAEQQETKPAVEQAAPAQPAAPVQEAAPAAQSTGTSVAVFNFEEGTQKWYPKKGVKLSQTTIQPHQGKASLKVTGTAAKGEWDFAQSPKFNLVPGKHYKFSGWMKIDSINPADSKTYVWLRVSLLKDKQWLKNVISRNYNLKKKGEWQLLTAEFDAPEGATTGMFNVDKRPETKDITATICIDDIKIEQMN